jgi:hypothetical protein
MKSETTDFTNVRGYAICSSVWLTRRILFF